MIALELPLQRQEGWQGEVVRMDIDIGHSGCLFTRRRGLIGTEQFHQVSAPGGEFNF